MSATPGTGPTYARLGARVGAYLIDYALQMGVLVLGWVIAAASIAAQSNMLSVMGLAVMVLGTLGLSLFFIIAVGRHGRTPGMKLVGLGVVDADTGSPIGVGRAFVRYLVLGLLGCLNLIQLITIGNHPRRQGWHDLAARSVVVTMARGAAPGVTKAPSPTPSLVGNPEVGARSPDPLSAPTSGVGGSLATQPSQPPTSQPPTSQPAAPAPPSVALPPATAMVAPPPGIVPSPPGATAPVADTVRGPVPPAPGAVSVPPASEVAIWTLRSVTGETARIAQTLLVGRDPDPGLFAGAQRWAVTDPDLSVSKTHAVFGLDAGTPWVQDWNSTNGVEVRRGADVHQVAAQQQIPIQAGDTVVLGNLEITVERS